MNGILRKGTSKAHNKQKEHANNDLLSKVKTTKCLNLFGAKYFRYFDKSFTILGKEEQSPDI